jgi:hypothetical protein
MALKRVGTFDMLFFRLFIRGALFPRDPVLAVGPGRKVDHPAPGGAEGAVGVAFPGCFFPAAGTWYGFNRFHSFNPQ